MLRRSETRPDPLLKDEQVAAWVGMSTGWLAWKRMQGSGPPFIYVGRSVRYRRSDVERWLAENQRTSTRSDADDGSEYIATILQTVLWGGGESPFEVRVTDAEGAETGARYRATNRGTFRLDRTRVDDLPLRSPTGELVFPLTIRVTDAAGRTESFTIRAESKPKTMIQ